MQQLSSTAREFVPAALRSFPPLAQDGKAIRAAAERALLRSSKDKKSTGSYAKAAAVEVPVAVTPLPSTLRLLGEGYGSCDDDEEDDSNHVGCSPPRTDCGSAPPAPAPVSAPAPPPAPPVLFQVTASEAAQLKWKDRWCKAAKSALEQKQRQSEQPKDVGGGSGGGGGDGGGGGSGSGGGGGGGGGGWAGVLQPSELVRAASLADWAAAGKERSPVVEGEGEGEDEDEEEGVVDVKAPAVELDLELRAAILRNDVIAVQRVLAGCSLRSEGSAAQEEVFGENEELTPVMLAVKYGRDTILQLLLEHGHGTGIDVRDRKSKRTSLLLAAENGQLELTKLLLHNGASLESKDRAGESILHKAVRSGNASLVAWLCALSDKKDRNIKINLRNKRRETPLLLATSREVASVLLSAGADSSAKNSDGLDVKCLAARAGNAKLLECVVMHNSSPRRGGGGVDGGVNGGGSAGISGVDGSVPTTSPAHQAVLGGSLDCLRVVLLAGATTKEINMLDASGNTVLHTAVRVGRSEAVELLLTQGKASPTAEDSQGATAFTLAAYHGRRDVLKLLAQHAHPAQIQRVNSQGETVLECLVRIMFANCLPAMGHGVEDRRRTVVQSITQPLMMSVFLDLFELGLVLTDAVIRRLVPFRSVSYVKDLQTMFDDPSSCIEKPTASDLFLSSVGSHPPPLRLTFMGIKPAVKSEDDGDGNIAVPAKRYALVVVDGLEVTHVLEDIGYDVRLEFEETSEFEDGREGKVKMWAALAHKTIIAAAPKLEGMLRFTAHQQQQQKQHLHQSSDALLVLTFTGDAVRRRAFFRLLHFLYTSNLPSAAEDVSAAEGEGEGEGEEEEQLLLELVWLADEFLMPELSSLVEQTLLKRLILSAPDFSHAEVFLHAGTALGLASLGTAAAVALLKTTARKGKSVGRELAEHAFRSLLQGMGDRWSE